MKIESTYITFEQAKLLKEKGFDCPCRSKFLRGKAISNGIHNPFFCEPLEDIIEMPEQHIVIEWLRVKHGIWIPVLQHYINGDEIFYEAVVRTMTFSGYKTPQEAYSAAIDYTLNNLI